MNKEQIIYEDKDIIVCHKPTGIATQTAKVGQRDMVSEVTNYLAAASKTDAKPGKRPYVGLIHRLDQPVEGILVFAKNQRAAGELSKQVSDGRMEKYYYAVVVVDGGAAGAETDAEIASKKAGEMCERTLINYLCKDNKSNTSQIADKGQSGVKKAELHYRLLSCMPVNDFCKKYYDAICNNNTSAKIEGGTYFLADYENTDIALARIKLITGRHHQIRVQMSNARISLLGDYKYADDKTVKISGLLGQKQVALCAYELAFNHPVTGKRLSFYKDPEAKIFQIFSL